MREHAIWETTTPAVRSRPLRLAALAAAAVALAAPAAASADNVIADDQIVQGSQCVGLDCVNNEPFGFSTQIYKENNNRILFNDTSATPGFSTRNWGLIANANGNPGADYFGLMDLGADGTDVNGAGIYPFKVAAGAGDNALSIDGQGDVGIGTAEAALDLQIKRQDTPAIRLDQDPSGGYTAQTWDVGGNEANFFVRDATAGSRLVFRIRPGAPTSSLDVNGNGNVGIGIAAPSAPLDVQRGNGTAKVRVAETSATTDMRNLLDLVNNGAANISYTDTSPGTHPTWLAGTGGTDGNDFLIDTQGSAVPPLSIDAAGSVVSGGALSQGADPAQLTDVQPVDPNQVLSQIATLPLQTWTYAGDVAGGRHIGPKAADLKAASGLGPNAPAVAPGDVGGVALAGVQALNAKVTALGGGGSTGDPAQARQNKKFKKQIGKLRKQNKKLNKRVKKLEKAVFKR